MNNPMTNGPMSIIATDPEDAVYLLMSTLLCNDNEEAERNEWIEFKGRRAIYDYIKGNLTLDIDSLMIDLNKSYVLINGEPYNSENKRTALMFMTIVKDVYNDDFNPNDFVIRDEEY